MNRTANQLGLQEFLSLPDSDRYELVEGQLQPKMSPKYKHSTLQLRLLIALNQWCEQQKHGRVRPEWGVILQRQQKDWVPVPDLIHVSYGYLNCVANNLENIYAVLKDIEYNSLKKQ
ncbi:Uma2 family endonuclease [Gloeocapsopsis crepidinum]|uniref:Uma2 family endonuclease n=1 Tax=Gloeocapsopsis crepidinum TaxID=693223 RepID=UPI001D1440F5|nr:Uma2 family endonuclease [Gloeocapsopsis crepidinum]